MSVRQEVERERRQSVGLDLRHLRQIDWKQLGVRFAFGAAIALAAGLIGLRFGPRIGGVFLAFPAILPAALTLLERSEGTEKTDVDAVGAGLGAVAMVAFAAVVTLLAARAGPVVAIAAAAAVWAVGAVALFFAARPLLKGFTRRR